MKRIIYLHILLFCVLGQAFAQSTVEGYVFYDENTSNQNNCHWLGEPVFRFCPVVLTSSSGEEFVALTDHLGLYRIDVPNGNYTVSAHPYSNNNFEESTCSSNIVAAFGSGPVIHHVPMTALTQCSQLAVDVVSKSVVPNSAAKHYFSYENIGSEPAVNPTLYLSPSAMASYNSLPQGSQIGSNSGVIEIPIVQGGQSLPALSERGYVEMNLGYSGISGQSTVSNLLTGGTDDDCSLNGQWDLSTVEVEGSCLGTDSTRFYIRNTGSGPMSQPKNFIIVQDDLLVHSYGSFQLESGEDTMITVFGGYMNQKLTAEQSDFHPYLGDQTVLVHSCVPPNYANLNPYPAVTPPFTIVAASPVSPTSSSDLSIQPAGDMSVPATMEIYPHGNCDDREIVPGQRMEFTLRARNYTGSASTNFKMRFNVPEELDLATFIPGASSEEYRVTMNGQLLEWTFPNSTLYANPISQQLDQAVVKFSIMLKDNAVIGQSLTSHCEVIIDGQLFTSETHVQVFVDELEQCFEVSTDNQWTGAVSTNWHTAGNWSYGSVPSGCEDDVIINLDLPNQPVINGQVQVGSVQLMGNGPITNNSMLRICGDIEIDGALSIAGDGLFSLQSTEPQSISGVMEVERLRIANSTEVTLESGGELRVHESLQIGGGEFIATGSVVLLSDENGTAYLDDFSPSIPGTFTGDLTVERYIPTNGFHHMGAAVDVDNIAIQLSEANLSGENMGQIIPLEGCPDDGVASNSPNGNMFEWHEDGPFPVADCNQSGWYVRSSGPMEPGRGYALNANAGLTFSLTGQPHLSPVSFGPLDATNSIGNGFHLVSNPYPCEVEWTGHNGFGGAIYIWLTSGPYVNQYSNVFPNEGYRIPSQQGFFVLRDHTAGAGPFTIPLSARRTGSSVYHRISQQDEIDVILKGNGAADHTMIRFDDMASLNFEYEVDAMKMDGGPAQPHIASTNGFDKLSVNTLNFMPDLEIPLIIRSATEGTHVLSFETERTDLVLEDRKLNIAHRIGSDYSFEYSFADENRFALKTLGNEEDIDPNQQGLEIHLAQDRLMIIASTEGKASIEIIDAIGRSVLRQSTTLTVGGNAFELPDVTIGQYIIRVANSQTMVHKKVFIR